MNDPIRPSPSEPRNAGERAGATRPRYPAEAEGERSLETEGKPSVPRWVALIAIAIGVLLLAGLVLAHVRGAVGPGAH